MLVAEQGKTVREARHRAAQGGRHARALRRPGEGGPRRVRARPRPGRRRPRAAQAARRRRGDRAVELPDDAAVQQARPGARVRQHGRRQAGRHDAVHDAAAGRDPHRGGPAAGRAQRRHRAPAPRRARRSSPTRSTRKVAFTGSTPTGERVMALAARGTKRVTLELGGSDPMIICDDADLAKAASAAAMGRFYNCGQACLAIKRVYVFASVADEVIEAIAAKARRLRVGIGTDEGVQLGPMHTERQRAIMEDQIARTLSGGGEIVAGGGRPDDPRAADGWFHEPTVVVDPPHGSPMAREEVFGPALPIWRVRDFDQAIAAGQRLAVRPRLVGVDGEPRPRRARGRGDRRGLHVDQLADEGLRRAAVRRRRRRADTARSTAPRRSTTTPTRSRWSSGGRHEHGRRHRGGRALARALQRELHRRPPRRVGPRGQGGVRRVRRDADLRASCARQVNRAGHLLRALGVAREQRVLLVLDDTTAFPILFLGAMRIGAVPGAGQPARQGRATSATTSRTPTRRVVCTDAGYAAAAARRRSAATTSLYVARGAAGDDVVELDDGLAAQDDELDAGRDAPRRHGVLALQLGLDRQAEGRRAPAPRHRGHVRELRRARCSGSARTT